MQLIKIFTIKKPIVKMKMVENNRLVVIDEENGIRVFNLEELKLESGLKINLPKNRIFGNGVDVANNGEYLALTIEGKNKIVLWNIKNKKLFKVIGWHKGEIESVAFDKKDRYVATGGTDGRTHLWNINTGKMVGSLAPHSDYVTAIAFTNNSLWCATGSYDKSISITNISSMKFAYKLKIHLAMVTKIKFIPNFRMISGDKEGHLVCSNYAKGNVIKRLPKLREMIVDFCFDINYKYMFASAKNRTVVLYSLETYEILREEFITTNSTITSLEFIPELFYLVIGTVDGIIYIYDLLADEKELDRLIDEKNYSEAYKLINENPLLKESISYSHLEKIWEHTLNQAQKLLENSQKESAEKILKPFMGVPSKRMFIQSLFKDFAEFEKFKQLVLKGKYPLAYSLANKYPSFKETKYYKHMEKEFKKVFAIARQLMFDKSKEEYIKKILMPFRGVSEKTSLIQSLLNEKDIYKLMKQRMAKKDFKGFFELVNRYPFLANLEEYKKTLEFGEKIKAEAEKNLKEGNYNKVLQYVSILDNFPIFAKELETLRKKATILANFMKLLANKEYDKVYEYVKKEPFLEEIDSFKELEEEWNRKIEEAELYSSKGDEKRVLESLKHYLKIKEKLPKIGQLVKSAYLYQLLEKLKTEVDDEVIERGFKNYIKIFGLDLEVSDLITLAEKSGRKLNFRNLEEGDKINWYKKELPYDIFS